MNLETSKFTHPQRMTEDDESSPNGYSTDAELPLQQLLPLPPTQQVLANEVRDGGELGELSVEGAVEESIEAIPQTYSLEDTERYNMMHHRKRLSLIFYHRSVSKGREAEKDRDKLIDVLEVLSFEVKVHEDLSFEDIIKNLEDVSSGLERHPIDCLFVVVLTDANESGMLHAKDKPYSSEEIWSRFTADKVSSLAGKPKIFLFQANRGNEDDVLHKDSPDGPLNCYYSIPTSADFLFVHSPLNGYHSLRGPDEGSWLVQYFCEILEENVGRRDILTMITLTLSRIADRITTVTGCQDLIDKEMPVVHSTLTKSLYFDAKPLFVL